MRMNYLGAIVEPINEARLWTFNIMSIIREIFLASPLDYQLHGLNAAFEMGVEISCYSREGDLVLFVGIFVHHPD